MTPAESLIGLVIQADAFLRRKNRLPPVRFQPRQRIWVEPFFNIGGHLLGQLLLLLPGAWRRRTHLWMCVQMAQHAPEPFPAQARYRQEVVQRARTLYQRYGQWPAVLFLTSHPDTLGPSAWLRFELLRQALWIADALVVASPRHHLHSHPRCFLAIDPFALDSVSVPVSAFYAGLVHSQYIVWDRQHSTQSWVQKKWLLAGTGHDRIAWRLLKALRQDPVLMVLAGGMPANARLFYAVREWAGTLKDARKKYSKHQIRYRAMEILSTDIHGHLPTETGVILPETEKPLNAFLEELGYSAAPRRVLLEQLSADFKSEIPLRLRLWKVLQARLVRRGIPLLVLPLDHATRLPHTRLGPFFEMTEQTDCAAFAKGVHDFYTEPLVK